MGRVRRQGTIIKKNNKNKIKISTTFHGEKRFKFLLVLVVVAEARSHKTQDLQLHKSYAIRKLFQVT